MLSGRNSPPAATACSCGLLRHSCGCPAPGPASVPPPGPAPAPAPPSAVAAAVAAAAAAAAGDDAAAPAAGTFAAVASAAGAPVVGTVAPAADGTAAAAAARVRAAAAAVRVLAGADAAAAARAAEGYSRGSQLAVAWVEACWATCDSAAGACGGPWDPELGRTSSRDAVDAGAGVGGRWRGCWVFEKLAELACSVARTDPYQDHHQQRLDSPLACPPAFKPFSCVSRSQTFFTVLC